MAECEQFSLFENFYVYCFGQCSNSIQNVKTFQHRIKSYEWEKGIHSIFIVARKYDKSLLYTLYKHSTFCTTKLVVYIRRKFSNASNFMCCVPINLILSEYHFMHFTVVDLMLPIPVCINEPLPKNCFISGQLAIFKIHTWSSHTSIFQSFLWISNIFVGKYFLFFSFGHSKYPTMYTTNHPRLWVKYFRLSTMWGHDEHK